MAPIKACVERELDALLSTLTEHADESHPDFGTTRNGALSLDNLLAVLRDSSD